KARSIKFPNSLAFWVATPVVGLIVTNRRALFTSDVTTSNPQSRLVPGSVANPRPPSKDSPVDKDKGILASEAPLSGFRRYKFGEAPGCGERDSSSTEYNVVPT